MNTMEININCDLGEKSKHHSNINDQKRTLNPKQAYRNGADWLVIGRPITKGNIKKNVQTLIDHLNQ